MDINSIIKQASSRLDNSEDTVTRSYDAALIKSISSFTSVNSDAYSSLETIRNVSREMAKNNPVMTNYLLSLANNVLGDNGIKLDVRLKSQLLSKRIERSWRKFSLNCDSTGVQTLQEILHWCVTSLARDGEIIIHYGIDPTTNNVTVQTIDADLLDYRSNTVYKPESTSLNDLHRVVMGVETVNNRPTAYHILNTSYADYIDNSGKRPGIRIIPASAILHVFHKEYASQIRGIPQCASSLSTMDNIKKYLKYVISRMNLLAAMPLFAKSANPNALNSGSISLPNSSTDETKPNSPIKWSKPGSIEMLPEGVEIQNVDFKSTDMNHQSYIDMLFHITSGALGISYEELSNDYSKSNYSSSRLSRISEQTNYKLIQKMLIEKILKPLFNAWIVNERNNNRIRISENQVEELMHGDGAKWITKTFSPVDPEKAIKANAEAVSAGFKTKSDVLEEMGSSINEFASTLSKEQEVIPNETVHINNPES